MINVCSKSYDENDDQWLLNESHDKNDDVVGDTNAEYYDSSEDDFDLCLASRWEKFINDLTWEDGEIFNPTVYAFTQQYIGVQTSAKLDAKSTARETFATFFTEDMISMTCIETHLYFEKKLKIMRKTRILC